MSRPCFSLHRGAKLFFILPVVGLLHCPLGASSLSPMTKVGQPELPRFSHSTVWTGSKMSVWGGTVFRGESPLLPAGGNFFFENAGYAANDGGAYDPANDSWQKISDANAPSARAGHTAVWAQDRMIVWGGKGAGGNLLDDGYAYFPASDSWQKLSDSNSDEDAPSARAGHTAVWTGTEMIIWGGGGRTDGAAYNPSQDSWRPISSVSAPSARLGHGAVWCGTRMAVWGGQPLNSPVQSNGTGAFYDPVANSWSTIFSSGAPSGGDGDLEEFGDRAVQLFWTGTRLVAFVMNVPYGTPIWLAAGIYDPDTMSWQTISTAGAPSNTRPYFGAWSGTTLHIAASGGAAFKGCTYNFALNRWETKATGTTGSFRGRMGVWAPERQELLIFGGRWVTGTSDPSFSGGPEGQRGFRVSFTTDPAKAQRISFRLPPRMVYGGTYTLGAKATSALGIEYEVSDPTAAELVGTRLTILRAAPFLITARQAGVPALWKAADPVTLPAFPSRRPQTVSLALPPSVTRGQSVPLFATVNSPLAVEVVSSNPGILKVDGLTATALAPGRVTLTASQPGNENYAPARPVRKTLVVK